MGLYEAAWGLHVTAASDGARAGPHLVTATSVTAGAGEGTMACASHVPLSLSPFRSLPLSPTRRLPGRTWLPSTQPSGAWTKVGAAGQAGADERCSPSIPAQLCPSVRRDRAGPGGAAPRRPPQQHPGDLHLRQRHPLPRRQDQPVPLGHRRAAAPVLPRAPPALGAGQPGLCHPPG